jgi:plasmid stability protein
MHSLTIRNLSNETLARLRYLSARQKRSLNNEVLVLVETGLQDQSASAVAESPLSLEAQVQLWQGLAGRWADERATPAVIDDI